MAFIWIIIFYLMADVMGRGHDGDGREDPPPPGGRPVGLHEVDAVPSRRRRGKAKNLQLIPTWEENGKLPLTLKFDNYTDTTVGSIHDLFIREVGGYMQREISLDRESWKKVSAAEKNAMYQHLRPYFDIHSVMEDSVESRLKDGLEYMISSRYRGRKAKAKQHFMTVGGYEDVEGARANPPEGMSCENWNKTLTFFNSEKHMQRSVSNKANRAKQLITNRGGTSSYSSACFKRNLSRVQAFRDAHVNKDRMFDDPIVEEQYNALVSELQQQTQVSASSSNPTPVDEPAAFEKVLGSRRGHIKGIGHKGAGTTTSTGQSRTSQPSPTQVNYLQSLYSPYVLDSPSPLPPPTYTNVRSFTPVRFCNRLKTALFT